MAKYRLRYFFDPGANICLWSSNETARQEFGYPIEARSLPLPENTWRRITYLSAWYDTSLNWDYPPGPSPWDETDWQRFNSEAQRMLAVLREQLGSDFEILDESRTATSN